MSARLVRHLAICIGALLITDVLHADPPNDHLTYTGANAPGLNAIVFANNSYYFAFAGAMTNDNVIYQLDLSDPLVKGGVMRIHELISDSWPMDQAGVLYRDGKGNTNPADDVFWFPKDLASKVTLTSHQKFSGVVTLNYNLNFSGNHSFRYEISIQKRELRVRVYDPSSNTNVSNNFDGSYSGIASGVESPISVPMQGNLASIIVMFRVGNFHCFTSSMLDMFQSNGSDYSIPDTFNLQKGADWVRSGYDTIDFYKPMTNGKLAAALDDAYILVVSPHIQDVLLTSNAPPSPYRSLLMDRMFFDAPAKVWSYYTGMFSLYQSLGMYNLAGYFWDWSTANIDPPVDYNAGPDWAPAIDQTNFQGMLNQGTTSGAILAGHIAMNCLPASSPVSSISQNEIARDATGSPKLYYNLGFPLLSVEGSGIHALKETNSLKALGANAGYLDIQTYNGLSKAGDGDHLDQTYGSAWSKTMRKGLLAQKLWFEGIRDSVSGPLWGEGSIATQNSNMEFLWYGYVDSVQRCVNTGGGTESINLPAGSPSAPTNWPIIPEYEWRVGAVAQVNHGNGFFDRFFSKSDGPTVVDMATGKAILPLTQDARDLYNVYALTYAHTGFLMTNGNQNTTEGYVTHEAAADTYFMTNALQSLFFSSPLVAIRYQYNGGLKTFEQVLFQTETIDTFRHIPIVFDYNNGMRIYVNHGFTPMNITDNGVSYTLPARTGWYASAPGLITCFSAIPGSTGGARIDYCNAPGQYEYFNGRGAVSGYGGITGVTDKRIKYKIIPTNITVTEDAAGVLHPVQGTPGVVTQVLIAPDSVVLSKGSRTGMKAVAYYNNGGVRDVTTLVNWTSSNPSIAKISSRAMVTAVASGAVSISTTGFGGVVAAPIIVTVP